MMTCPSVPAIPTLWLFSILLLVVSLNAQNKKPSNEDKVPDTTLFTSFPDHAKSSPIEGKPGTLVGVITVIFILGVAGFITFIYYRHRRS
uniref:Secreted and transmembrane 1A n=1 Tax=Mus musculus TaxID=10090 RepID=A2ABP8_MOUSE